MRNCDSENRTLYGEKKWLNFNWLTIVVKHFRFSLLLPQFHSFSLCHSLVCVSCSFFCDTMKYSVENETKKENRCCVRKRDSKWTTWTRQAPRNNINDRSKKTKNNLLRQMGRIFRLKIRLHCNRKSIKIIRN